MSGIPVLKGRIGSACEELSRLYGSFVMFSVRRHAGKNDQGILREMSSVVRPA